MRTMRDRPMRDRPANATGRPLEIVLALLLVLFLTAVLGWRKDRSLDLGFHAATGRYILQTHHWPKTDPFTYTMSDHPYITMHGLFQIGVAVAEKVAGEAGPSLLREILILAAMGLIWMNARRREVRSPTVLILGCALGLLALSLRFFVRPELATYVGLAAFLFLLRRHAEDGQRRWLLALPAVQLVWTYSHALSLFGPAVAGIYAATGLFGNRRRDPMPWVAAVLCGLALFANPYGLEGVRFLWNLHTRMQGENAFARTVGELYSPFTMRPPVPLAVRWFEILLVLSAVVLIARIRRFSLFDLATAVFFGILASIALRNVGMFVVAILPLFLSGAQQLVDAVGNRRNPQNSRRSANSQNPRRTANTQNSQDPLNLLDARGPQARGIRARAPLAAAILIVLGLSVGVVSGAYYARDGGGFDAFGSGPSPSVYPIHNVDRIVKDNLRGPIYNYFNFGGYLTGRLWPREKTFIDGRLEVVGEKFLFEHLAIQQGAKWGEMVSRYDPNIALINSSNVRLVQKLNGDPDWALIDLDGVSALFLRRRPENATEIAAADETWRQMDVPLTEPDGTLMPRRGGIRNANRTPWVSIGRGNALYTIGLDRAAWRAYRDAVMTDVAVDGGLAQNIAAACASLGRTTEAAAWRGAAERARGR
jgi:hypothetical protein